jgi:serine protease inhibitor
MKRLLTTSFSLRNLGFSSLLNSFEVRDGQNGFAASLFSEFVRVSSDDHHFTISPYSCTTDEAAN